MRLIDADELYQKLHEAGGCDASKGSWADGWDKAIDETIRMVVEAPTIEMYGTWIPCSERLPEYEGSYMTTTEYGAVRVNHFYTRHNTWGYKSNKTVAWMPMPEPYKGGEQNE